MDLDQPRGIWVVTGADKIIRVNKTDIILLYTCVDMYNV